MTVALHLKNLMSGGIILLVALLFLSGCTEKTGSNSEDDSIAKMNILGTWSMTDDTYNTTSFKIIYSFYENNSFFTGVKNLTSNSFEIKLWGTYSLYDSRMILTVPEQNSTSDLKYSLSDKGDTLLLYYEDETNFDMLTKE
jgi:hypothetical protein